MSQTIKYLVDQEWVTWWKVPLEKRPCWLKKYKLAVPFAEIVAVIERQKKKEACNQIDRVKYMQKYSGMGEILFAESGAGRAFFRVPVRM